MIVRIPKYETEYNNAIQLGIILMVTEFLVAMEYINVYNKESNKWNIRRAFWISFIGLPISVMLLIYTIAAIKFICQ